MPRRQPAPPPRDPLDNAPDLANAQRVIDTLVEAPASRTLQGRESGRHIVFERDGRSRGAAYVS